LTCVELFDIMSPIDAISSETDVREGLKWQR